MSGGSGQESWFRPPTRREHAIAAALFVGFAAFFGLLGIVLAGWWFRWVVLGLAVWSMAYAMGHLRDAMRRRGKVDQARSEDASHEPSGLA